jgi:hypothetical protein
MNRILWVHIGCKVMIHSVIYMNDSCFIYIIVHCNYLIDNEICMNDGMNVYPSLHLVVNQ